MRTMPPSKVSTAEPAGSGEAWYVVTLLWMIYTSLFIDQRVMALLVTPIRADPQISDTEMSPLSGFAFAVPYRFFGIPPGRRSDRHSQGSIILVGAVTWSLMRLSIDDPASSMIALTFSKICFA